MVALVQAFVDIIGVLITFVTTYLVPADASSITILHVAIWTPVVLGLLTLTIGMLRGMWRRGGRRA